MAEMGVTEKELTVNLYNELLFVMKPSMLGRMSELCSEAKENSGVSGWLNKNLANKDTSVDFDDLSSRLANSLVMPEAVFIDYDNYISEPERIIALREKFKDTRFIIVDEVGSMTLATESGLLGKGFDSCVTLLDMGKLFKDFEPVYDAYRNERYSNVVGKLTAEINELRAELNRSRRVVEVLTNIVDSRLDEYSKGHSLRVALYAKSLAEKMGKSVSEQYAVYEAGLVHDLGKAFIDKELLRTDIRFTDEQYAKMKEHPELGMQVLADYPEFNEGPLKDAILYHHERWNGKGYPYGRSGEEIPEIARVIALADSYDAIMTREYSRKDGKMRTQEDIMEDFRKNLGVMYDPVIGQIAIECINERVWGPVSLEQNHIQKMMNEAYKEADMAELRSFEQIKASMTEGMEEIDSKIESIRTRYALESDIQKSVAEKVNAELVDSNDFENLRTVEELLEYYTNGEGYEELEVRYNEQGLFYENVDVERWFEKEAEHLVHIHLEKLAIKGDKVAQYEFAMFTDNIEDRRHWLNESVKNGYEPAVTALRDFDRRELLKKIDAYTRDVISFVKEPYNKELDGVKTNNSYSRDELVSMAFSGDLDAAFALSKICSFDNDFEQSKAWLELAAVHGHAEAMALYGQNIHSGERGYEKDEAKGFKWTDKAALEGNVRGLRNAALYLRIGSGCEKNDELAFDYSVRVVNSEKATFTDKSRTYYNLGRAYENGEGVAKDMAKAEACYKASVLSGAAEGYVYDKLVEINKAKGTETGNADARLWQARYDYDFASYEQKKTFEDRVKDIASEDMSFLKRDVVRYHREAEGKVEGVYTPETGIITLFENHNIATIVHESGHKFFSEFMEDSAKPDAPEWMKQDREVLLRYVGMSDIEWRNAGLEGQREGQEKIAYGFEGYMLYEYPVESDMVSVYDKAADNLYSEYSSVKENADVNIPDEVKEIFERWSGRGTMQEVALEGYGNVVINVINSLPEDRRNLFESELDKVYALIDSDGKLTDEQKSLLGDMHAMNAINMAPDNPGKYLNEHPLLIEQTGLYNGSVYGSHISYERVADEIIYNNGIDGNAGNGNAVGIEKSKKEVNEKMADEKTVDAVQSSGNAGNSSSEAVNEGVEKAVFGSADWKAQVLADVHVELDDNGMPDLFRFPDGSEYRRDMDLYPKNNGYHPLYFTAEGSVRLATDGEFRVVADRFPSVNREDVIYRKDYMDLFDRAQGHLREENGSVAKRLGMTFADSGLRVQASYPEATMGSVRQEMKQAYQTVFGSKYLAYDAISIEQRKFIRKLDGIEPYPVPEDFGSREWNEARLSEVKVSRNTNGELVSALFPDGSRHDRNSLVWPETNGYDPRVFTPQGEIKLTSRYELERLRSITPFAKAERLAYFYQTVEISDMNLGVLRDKNGKFLNAEVDRDYLGRAIGSGLTGAALVKAKHDWIEQAKTYSDELADLDSKWSDIHNHTLSGKLIGYNGRIGEEDEFLAYVNREKTATVLRLYPENEETRKGFELINSAEVDEGLDLLVNNFSDGYLAESDLVEKLKQNYDMLGDFYRNQIDRSELVLAEVSAYAANDALEGVAYRKVLAGVDYAEAYPLADGYDRVDLPAFVNEDRSVDAELLRSYSTDKLKEIYYDMVLDGRIDVLEGGNLEMNVYMATPKQCARIDQNWDAMRLDSFVPERIHNSNLDGFVANTEKKTFAELFNRDDVHMDAMMSDDKNVKSLPKLCASDAFAFDRACTALKSYLKEDELAKITSFKEAIQEATKHYDKVTLKLNNNLYRVYDKGDFQECLATDTERMAKLGLAGKEAEFKFNNCMFEGGKINLQQREELKKNKIKVTKDMSYQEARDKIRELPPTKEQMDYAKKFMKADEVKDLNRGQLGDIIAARKKEYAEQMKAQVPEEIYAIAKNSGLVRDGERYTNEQWNEGKNLAGCTNNQLGYIQAFNLEYMVDNMARRSAANNDFKYVKPDTVQKDANGKALKDEAGLAKCEVVHSYGLYEAVINWNEKRVAEKGNGPMEQWQTNYIAQLPQKDAENLKNATWKEAQEVIAQQGYIQGIIGKANLSYLRGHNYEVPGFDLKKLAVHTDEKGQYIGLSKEEKQAIKEEFTNAANKQRLKEREVKLEHPSDFDMTPEGFVRRSAHAYLSNGGSRDNVVNVMIDKFAAGELVMPDARRVAQNNGYTSVAVGAVLANVFPEAVGKGYDNFKVECAQKYEKAVKEREAKTAEKQADKSKSDSNER